MFLQILPFLETATLTLENFHLLEGKIPESSMGPSPLSFPIYIRARKSIFYDDWLIGAFQLIVTMTWTVYCAHG